MKIAELVLEYLTVLVWPLVVCGVLIGYRGTFRVLMARLLQLQAGPVSATFNTVAEEATLVTDGPPPFEVPSLNMPPKRIDATSYLDAPLLGKLLRRGHAVHLVLTDTPDVDAKRLVDFSAGLIYMSRGYIERLQDRFFLLVPGVYSEDEYDLDPDSRPR